MPQRTVFLFVGDMSILDYCWNKRRKENKKKSLERLRELLICQLHALALVASVYQF